MLTPNHTLISCKIHGPVLLPVEKRTPNNFQVHDVCNSPMHMTGQVEEAIGIKGELIRYTNQINLYLEVFELEMHSRQYRHNFLQTPMLLCCYQWKTIVHSFLFMGQATSVLRLAERENYPSGLHADLSANQTVSFQYWGQVISNSFSRIVCIEYSNSI